VNALAGNFLAVALTIRTVVCRQIYRRLVTFMGNASFDASRPDIFKNHCSLKRGSIRHIGAFAETNVIRVRLFLFQRAEFGEFFHGHFARLETVEAAQVRARCVVFICRSPR